MDQKKTDLAITIGVGLFAAVNSYNHVYSVARNAGQDKLSSAVLWFAVDGLILVGVRNMGRHWLGHVALWAGVASTMAAQVLCGLNHGPKGIIVSVWPAGAFLLCIEIANRRSAPKPAPVAEPESAPESAPLPRPRREPRAIARTLAVAPDALTELRAQAERGALPSKREIKTRARVGWDRAVQIHGELAALAPA